MKRHLINFYKNQHASFGIPFILSTPFGVEPLATKLDDGEGVSSYICHPNMGSGRCVGCATCSSRVFGNHLLSVCLFEGEVRDVMRYDVCLWCAGARLEICGYLRSTAALASNILHFYTSCLSTMIPRSSVLHLPF